jgi:hypothetical protein
MNRNEAIQKLINAAGLCADLVRQDEEAEAFVIEAEAMERAGSSDVEGMQKRIRQWLEKTPKWKDTKIALQCVALMMEPFEMERTNK